LEVVRDAVPSALGGEAGWRGVVAMVGGGRWQFFFISCEKCLSSVFFHSLSITSIFSHLHGVLNIGKKNN